MAAAALIGWKSAERLGLFGASILGSMIVTAVLSLSGLIHARPPAEAILAAQLFISIGIGLQYVGVTLRELRGFVLSGFAFVTILAVLAAAFTKLVTLTGLANPVAGFMAFAPVAARLIGIVRPSSKAADPGDSTGASRLLNRIGLAAAQHRDVACIVQPCVLSWYP